MLSPPESGHSRRLHVSIIGGGITGVCLALGLQERGVDYTIYERASGFKEIGAGIGISPNAEHALKLLDPRAQEAYRRIAMPNGEDYFQWVDGHGSNEIIFKLFLGYQGFLGCRRSTFLDEMAKLIPEDNVKFDKEIEAVTEEPDERVLMRFKDGKAEVTDLVVGCDGIRSRVRQLLLGETHPASQPSYTNEFCFRALIPMEKARKALGDHRVSTRFMYNGPNAHAITYPVTSEVLNVLLVIADPKPWAAAGAGKHTARGRKQEALTAFAGWHPALRAIVDLLPDEMDKWAVFDTGDNPVPFYARGGVGLAGDAAHALGPHLGTGAGMGIEDVLVLSELLQAVDRSPPADSGTGEANKAGLCRRALTIYNVVRYDRTQRLVGLTRESCDLFQWRHKIVGSDGEKFSKEITAMFHGIWNYDIEAVLQEALKRFKVNSE